MPAAFTAYTGEAHWHVLLRARAIENQAFVFAPAQGGASGPRASTAALTGSRVVGPWGEVLAGAGEGFAFAEVDSARLAQVRRELPPLCHRRHDLL